MSTVRLEAVKTRRRQAQEIPMQPASQDIWDKKYRLKTKTGRAGRRRHRRHLPARRQGAGRGRADAPRSRSTGTSASSGRCAAGRSPPAASPPTPARSSTSRATSHDQLHRVGHHRRLDGRHPGQGPRGRPDAEGRLRHRLRILDAASARRVRRRRRRVHLGPDVLHGYLRQDVLHRRPRPVAAAARRWAPSTSRIRT